MDKEVLTAVCNSTNCCAKNGMFTCESGKCINTSVFCDGENDCPGHEDEIDDRCPGAVRNYEGIGLRSYHYDNCESGENGCWIYCDTEGNWLWMTGKIFPTMIIT